MLTRTIIINKSNKNKKEQGSISVIKRNNTAMASRTDGQRYRQILASNSTRFNLYFGFQCLPNQGLDLVELLAICFCLYQNVQLAISPTSHACAISCFFTIYQFLLLLFYCIHFLMHNRTGSVLLCIEVGINSTNICSKFFPGTTT